MSKWVSGCVVLEATRVVHVIISKYLVRRAKRGSQTTGFIGCLWIVRKHTGVQRTGHTYIYGPAKYLPER